MCLSALTACALRTSGSSNEIHVLTVADPFFYGLQDLLPEFEKQTGIRVSMEGLDYNTLDSTVHQLLPDAPEQYRRDLTGLHLALPLRQQRLAAQSQQTG